jgi:aspartate kinase
MASQRSNSEKFKMERKVAKFGGSSLADRESWKNVKKIIYDDYYRAAIVLSALGKRYSEDSKVTDLLLDLAKTKENSILNKIVERYEEIFPEQLNSHISLRKDLENALDNSEKPFYLDYLASRGEYWMAKMGAKDLGLGNAFVDARDIFDVAGESCHGKILDSSYKKIKESLSETQGKTIIPGFFGKNLEGEEILTFDRGDTDITGSCIAVGICAEVYEKFTDSPIFAADPNLVENPRKINQMTYTEIRDLACSGFNILQEEAMFPVSKSKIPIHVRSTKDYPEEGTWVTNERLANNENIAVGVAYMGGLCAFDINCLGLIQLLVF